MRKIIALFLCSVMLVCAAASAEQAQNGKVSIGVISINGAFDLQCGLPEGYSVKPMVVKQDTLIAVLLPEDESRPSMYLSVAFDETYSDVDRMNDLDEEALELLEKTYTDVDPTVELSYGETGLGTRLLIARQSGDDVTNYIDFLSIYKGYFIEFIMTAGASEKGRKLSDDELRLCIDFLTDLDFIPAAGSAAGVEYAGKTYPAVIGVYNAADNTVAVTLRAPVILDRETADALEVGGTIALGAENEEIYAVDRSEDGYVTVNDEIELRPQEDGSYRVYLYEREYRTDLLTVQAFIPETLVFTDNIDPESLEPLEEPLRLTAADFTAELESGEGVCFAAENVNVTFDENGDLAEISRVYVPWQ